MWMTSSCLSDDDASCASSHLTRRYKHSLCMAYLWQACSVRISRSLLRRLAHERVSAGRALHLPCQTSVACSVRLCNKKSPPVAETGAKPTGIA